MIHKLLGHAKIATTELHTRVSINLLKQVYLATHPGAHGKPAAVPPTERNVEAGPASCSVLRPAWKW